MNGFPTQGAQLEQALQKALKKLDAIEIKLLVLDEKLDEAFQRRTQETLAALAEQLNRIESNLDNQRREAPQLTNRRSNECRRRRGRGSRPEQVVNQPFTSSRRTGTAEPPVESHGVSSSRSNCTTTGEKGCWDLKFEEHPLYPTPAPVIANRSSVASGLTRVTHDLPETSTRLRAWVKFYTKYHIQLEKDVKNYESNATQKQLRQSIRKSITARINFATKKQSTDEELGKLTAFFSDLLQCRAVRERKDSRSTFKLECGNEEQLKYAMWTICTRFIEQIKWDQELIGSVMHTMVTMCLRQTELYHMFNAVVLHESTFMKLSGRAVLAKLRSLLNTPPEASTNWIAGEQSIFRLFYWVQFHLWARSDFVQKLREAESAHVHDSEPVQMFLAGTLALPEPVLMSSVFIAGEVLDEACLKKQLLKNDQCLMSTLPTLLTKAEAVANYDWELLLRAASTKLRQGAPAETAAKVNVLLRSRHESLLHQLKRSIHFAHSTK